MRFVLPSLVKELILPSFSDLKVSLGKECISNRENYHHQTVKPKFHDYFQLNTALPGDSTLRVEVLDHDDVGGDGFIGSTTIDLHRG